MQIEFAVLNALFQESAKDFLPNTKAFLHDRTTEPQIHFKKLVAARDPVDDVGTCAVLSHDCPQDSFCGRPFLRRGGPLPDSEGPVLVAIRVHYPDAFAWRWRTEISAGLGSVKAVEERIASLHSQAVLDMLPSAAVNVALVLAGIAVLLLFCAQPSSREYFWLGLYLLLVGTSFGLYTAFLTGLIPKSFNDFYADPIIYVFSCAQIEFIFAFVHRRVNRFWRMYEFLLLACLVCSVLYMSNILQMSVYLLIESLVIVPPAVALPFVLFFWYRRGNSEAGWLIVPSPFYAVGVVIPNIPFIPALLHLNLPNLIVAFRLWGLASVFVYDLADGLFLLAIGAVIFVRFTRVSRQQAIAAAEFEAARAVQQVLVPVENPAIPGFRIDGLYLPAGEVGGDFYADLCECRGASCVDYASC